jgi:hypothetical protein
MDSSEEAPAAKGTPLLRYAAHALYLPLMGGLGYLVVLCFLILSRGDLVGARAVPYGAVLFVVGRRYFRIYSGELDGPQLWKDVAALAVIDVLLAVIWLDYFA